MTNRFHFITPCVTLISLFICSNLIYAQEHDFKFFYDKNTNEIVEARALSPIPTIPNEQQLMADVSGMGGYSTDPYLGADIFLDILSQEASARKQNAFHITDVVENLTPVSVEVHRSNQIFIKYNQKKDGVPVLGSELNVTLTSRLRGLSVSGRALPLDGIETRSDYSQGEVELLVRSQVEGAAAWQNAMNEIVNTMEALCFSNQQGMTYSELYSCVLDVYHSLRSRLDITFSHTPELVIYNSAFLRNVRPLSKSRLVWKTTVSVDNATYSYTYYIDAKTGKVVEVVENSGELTPRYVYDCSLPSVNTCVFDFDFAGYTFGRSEGKPLRGPNPYNGSTDVDIAYDMVNDVHDYYINILGRDGANDRGGIGDNVHAPYDSHVINTHVNNLSSVAGLCTLGVGAATQRWNMSFCTDSVVPDIFAHEYAHHVTYNMSYGVNDEPRELILRAESGALSEAYSDLMGEAFENYFSGQADWKAGTGTALIVRDFADPTSVENTVPGIDSFPVTYSDPNYYCGNIGRSGIHTNSAVFNKANYLMSEGGTFNDCQIQGIGVDKVALLWTETITNYFLTSETFSLAYIHLNAMCNLLANTPGSGFSANDCIQVEAALQSVKLDQPGGCICTEWDPDDENECMTYAQHPNIGSTAPATCALPSGGRPGDFNGDDIVDKSDWTVWFESKGQEGENLPADADGSGRVGTEDCQIWKDNFGAGTCLTYSTEGCTEPEYFSGDFNRNGVTDSADYVTWRNSFGASSEQGAPFFPMDGNKDGRVDAADYTIWRDNYGAGSCLE